METSKNTVSVEHSLLETIKAGKFYPTLKNNNKSYIFDRVGKKNTSKQQETKMARS